MPEFSSPAACPQRSNMKVFVMACGILVFFAPVMLASTGGDWMDEYRECVGSECDEDFDEVVMVKRASPSSFIGGNPGPLMEMLSRRSALDKNFMRFGRSDGSIRPPRGENFMRFGRGDADSEEYDRVQREDKSKGFIRFGRSNDKGYLRFGRAGNNHMRFGRSADPGYMRFGRNVNMLRFGRTPADVQRFGRAKDNYVRFGRAKDSFVRFGKSEDHQNITGIEEQKRTNMMRFGRAKDSYVRFGRRDDFMRFGRNNGNNNFVRFGRNGNSNFVRFGRSRDELGLNADKEETSATNTNKHPQEEENSSAVNSSDAEEDLGSEVAEKSKPCQEENCVRGKISQDNDDEKYQKSKSLHADDHGQNRAKFLQEEEVMGGPPFSTVM